MDKPNNPQAFPAPAENWGLGMTLRDWFAGQALPSTMRLVTSLESIADETMVQTFARRAYEMADAMLAERERGQ